MRGQAGTGGSGGIMVSAGPGCSSLRTASASGDPRAFPGGLCREPASAGSWRWECPLCSPCPWLPSASPRPALSSFPPLISPCTRGKEATSEPRRLRTPALGRSRQLSFLSHFSQCRFLPVSRGAIPGCGELAPCASPLRCPPTAELRQ